MFGRQQFHVSRGVWDYYSSAQQRVWAAASGASPAQVSTAGHTAFPFHLGAHSFARIRRLSGHSDTAPPSAALAAPDYYTTQQGNLPQQGATGAEGLLPSQREQWLHHTLHNLSHLWNNLLKTSWPSVCLGPAGNDGLRSQGITAVSGSSTSPNATTTAVTQEHYQQRLLQKPSQHMQQQEGDNRQAPHGSKQQRKSTLSASSQQPHYYTATSEYISHPHTSVLGLPMIHPNSLGPMCWFMWMVLVDMLYTAFWVPLSATFCNNMAGVHAPSTCGVVELTAGGWGTACGQPAVDRHALLLPSMDTWCPACTLES